MAKALVIGANGFLGSHLTDRLVREGHEVTAFDRFSSGKISFSASEAKLVAGDFLALEDVREAITGKDLVFHFLSTSTPASSEIDSLYDLKTNVEGTVQLLDVCVQNKIKKFYFASTGGAIYGDVHGELLNENLRCDPVSPYAIGKLTIEKYLKYYARAHGIESVIFRISNPYGPGVSPNKKQGLIPITLRNVIAGKPAVQFGDGEMVRDYIFVDDLMQMIIQIVQGRPNHSLYNLGSGLGLSVRQVFDEIKNVTKASFPILEMPQPETYVSRAVLDISRYANEFELPEFTTLNKGLQKMLKSE